MKSISRGLSALRPSSSFSSPVAISLRNFTQVSEEAVKSLINSNILGKGETPQKSLVKAGKKHGYEGRLVTFRDPINAESISTLEIENSDSMPSAILSCGLGGAGSKRYLRESFAAFQKIVQTSKIAVYSSLTDTEERVERFESGLPFYKNESHIIEKESEHFFRKVFEPMFFKGTDLQNLDSVPDLVLFGFSIGHRENISHLNYLKQRIEEALNKERKNPDLLDEYFKHIAVVNIGSPVHWTGKSTLPNINIEPHPFFKHPFPSKKLILVVVNEAVNLLETFVNKLACEHKFSTNYGLLV
jgi:hypothetical protein